MKNIMIYIYFPFIVLITILTVAAQSHGAENKNKRKQSEGGANLEEILSSAKQALNAGKWNEAIKFYEKASKISGGGDEYLWGKGLALIRKGDYKSAKSFCKSFINKNRKSPYAHTCLGYDQMIWQRTSLAEKSFKDALSIDGNFSLAIAGMGRASFIAGNKEEAEKFFRDALLKNPYELEALTGLTEVLILDGRKQEAVAILKPALTKFADDPIFLAAYARAVGQGDEAENSAIKAVEIRKDWAQGHELLAEIRYKNGNYDGCIESAQKAIDLLPDLTEARKFKGICLYKKGMFNEAITILEEFMTKVPNSAEAMYYIGLSHDSQNNYEKAEEAYKNAMNMNLKFAEPVVALGNLYYRTGKPTSAISTMEKALALSPNSSLANLTIAEIYFERSNWKKAKEFYQKANSGDLISVDKNYILKRLKEVEDKIKESK